MVAISPNAFHSAGAGDRHVERFAAPAAWISA